MLAKRWKNFKKPKDLIAINNGLTILKISPDPDQIEVGLRSEHTRAQELHIVTSWALVCCFYVSTLKGARLAYLVYFEAGRDKYAECQ
jgi:hypothetical protein